MNQEVLRSRLSQLLRTANSRFRVHSQADAYELAWIIGDRPAHDGDLRSRVARDSAHGKARGRTDDALRPDLAPVAEQLGAKRHDRSGHLPARRRDRRGGAPGIELLGGGTCREGPPLSPGGRGVADAPGPQRHGDTRAHGEGAYFRGRTQPGFARARVQLGAGCGAGGPGGRWRHQRAEVRRRAGASEAATKITVSSSALKLVPNTGSLIVVVCNPTAGRKR
jgi:hypothetical protein